MHKIALTIFAPLDQEDVLPSAVKERAKEIGAEVNVSRGGYDISRRHPQFAIFELMIQHQDPQKLSSFARKIIANVYAK